MYGFFFKAKYHRIWPRIIEEIGIFCITNFKIFILLMERKAKRLLLFLRVKYLIIA